MVNVAKSPVVPLCLDWYLLLREEVAHRGFSRDIDWAQSVQPVSDALQFWLEFGWVVINSGMKNTVAQIIWPKVRKAVLSGESAASVFGHQGKSAAIDFVYAHRERLLAEYLVPRINLPT